MKYYKILFFLLCSSLIFAGGGKRNGTAGATELLIPVGARGVAMGGATIVNSTGLDGLFWNPANLALGGKSTNILLSTMKYIADINLQYAAVSAEVSSIGTFALSIKSIDIGEISETTTQYPDGTGSKFSPQYVTVGLAYAKQLNDRISVGINGNYVSETIGLVSASAVAFDIGISYRNLANIQGLDFGLVMKNLGTKLKFDGTGMYVDADPLAYSRGTMKYKIESAEAELPSSLDMGLGYKYAIDKQNEVALVTKYQYNNFWGDEYRVGAEYGYDNLFFARLGYQAAPELPKARNTFGFSAGFGVNYNIGDINLKFDYSYQDVKYFDDNHLFTLGIGI